MLTSLQGTTTGQLYAFSIANNMWTVMELGGILYVMATAIDYPQVRGSLSSVSFLKPSIERLAKILRPWARRRFNPCF